MNYQKILQQIASDNNTTPKAVDNEMREALMAAGYNIEPAAFICLIANKIKKDYIS